MLKLAINSVSVCLMFILEELFCSIDDFCRDFEPSWRKQQLKSAQRCRFRNRRLSLSEIMTILVLFHTSEYKNFKSYYLNLVSRYWRDAFPNLVSYQRFIEWMPSTVVPLTIYLRSLLATSTGMGFIDSTSIKVCHNRRIFNHQVFKGIARRGRTSVDWFFGATLRRRQAQRNAHQRF